MDAARGRGRPAPAVPHAISDELWAELEGEWSTSQLLELVVLNGWYRRLSQVINAAGVEREDWALRFADVSG